MLMLPPAATVIEILQNLSRRWSGFSNM